MGCCQSQAPPPETVTKQQQLSSVPRSKLQKKVESYTKEERIEKTAGTAPTGKPSIDSNSTPKRQSEAEQSYSPDDFDIPNTELEEHKSNFQLKMEQRKSELLREKAKLAELQQSAFEKQVAAQQSRSYKRLYDVWEQYATSTDGTTMNIEGLTKALAVFGMIIDSDRDLQRHIFRKFDADNKHEITYDDFSATIASFVGSNTDDDSLQTLFEIFDNDQNGYLELEDMARILLAQNQIAIVVTGQLENHTVYTKHQCLKQARRMVSEYDSDQFNDNKISFDEFKNMMTSRTEHDMIIDHMQAPSLSFKDRAEILQDFVPPSPTKTPTSSPSQHAMSK